jgi:hypothetical protein
MRNKFKIPRFKMMKFLGITILFTALIGIAACSELNLDGSEGEGTINFHIANSSASVQESVSRKANSPIEDLQEVNIDIHELRIRYSPVRIDTVSADSVIVEKDENGKSEWLSVPITPVKINLLDVSNADTLLSSTDLPAGYYSEIRLILGDDNDVVDQIGDVHPLMTPSGQQSGYKIKFYSRLHSGEEFDLTINFDVQKSIKVTGNNRYILHPVLNAEKGRNHITD